MSVSLRAALWVIFATLWVSGSCWILLHYLFRQASEFGPAPNPWEPLTLRIHGWVAVGGIFILGWLTGTHVSERWPQSIKRTSGIAVSTAAIVLSLTGYGLYYTADFWHALAAIVHEALGAAGIVFALTHWRRYRAGVASSSARQHAS